MSHCLSSQSLLSFQQLLYQHSPFVLSFRLQSLLVQLCYNSIRLLLHLRFWFPRHILQPFRARSIIFQDAYLEENIFRLQASCFGANPNVSTLFSCKRRQDKRSYAQAISVWYVIFYHVGALLIDCCRLESYWLIRLLYMPPPQEEVWWEPPSLWCLRKPPSGMQLQTSRLVDRPNFEAIP